MTKKELEQVMRIVEETLYNALPARVVAMKLSNSIKLKLEKSFPVEKDI